MGQRQLDLLVLWRLTIGADGAHPPSNPAPALARHQHRHPRHHDSLTLTLTLTLALTLTRRAPCRRRPVPPDALEAAAAQLERSEAVVAEAHKLDDALQEFTRSATGRGEDNYGRQFHVSE